MKKSYIIPVIFSALAMSSCVKDYECDLVVEKPESVEVAERLASLDVLKTYIDHQKNPNFTLGLTVNSADYASQALTYSIAKSNFDAVVDANAFSYGSTVGNDGTYSFANITNMMLDGAPAVLGSPIVAYSNVNKGHLDQVISANFVKGDLEMGKLTLADFEADAEGTVYEMSNGSIATVVADPKGQSGNVLQVGSPDNKAKNSYPVINITLPDGLTLGDLTNIVFDIFMVDETSSKKNLVLILNGVRKNFTGDTPAKRGCPVGDWARKIIEFNVADVALTDADKALSTFTLSLGPNVVNSYYYIDNITANWQTGEPDKYVEKTEAEKAQALAEDFDVWAKALMEVAAPNVNEYVVVAYPMSDDDAYMQRNADNETDLGNDITSAFFLNDYMGDNYVASLTNSLNKAYIAQAGVNPLKFYVKESGLLGNPGKVSRLLKQIAEWESAGAQIDGIAVELPLEYSDDATQQAANETAVANLLKALGQSGMLIRLDNVAMTNANADYYKYVISQYCSNVPADKLGGVIFEGTGDLWKDATRTLNYEAVIEGLK